jgi:membrane protein YdbS with pleckstrin-like domain
LAPGFCHLVLALVAAVLTFAESKQLDSVQLVVLQIVSALVVLFFWLVPMIRHVSHRLEVTTHRLVFRTDYSAATGEKILAAGDQWR